MTALPSPLDARERSRHFDELERQRFDLVVIGGGVTGAGIARDAALRGLTVALLEAQDYASGTSSRSSKMIHGGLRYLAQGHVALVRQSATERQVLRRIAPHLAKPERYLIPARSPGALAMLRAGLWVYERLGRVPPSQCHAIRSVAELAEREPLMRTEGLAGAAEYTEFLTDDARLVLANLRSARAVGALVLNYARADELISESDRIAGVVARSTLPGEERAIRVLGSVVVSATGAWVDSVRRLEPGQQDRRVALSRGIHFVVRRERLPVVNTVVLRASDRRMTYAVPHGRFTYVGTTDVFHGALEYWPSFDRSDLDYLLGAVSLNLRTDPIRDEEIVALWAGIRPLVAEPGKKANEVSRKDEIWTSPGGLVSIAGGKLSAYRAMAEDVVDLCVSRLGRSSLPCSTAERPLIGGERALSQDEIARLARDPLDAARLADLYGTEAARIAEQSAVHGTVAAEARHAVLAEGALTLEDWWVRRSARAWFDERAGLDALAPAAQAMGELLAWSDAERERQQQACRELDRASHSVLHTTGTTPP
jgi:glycerol-3-phosphate dehydrogenase